MANAQILIVEDERIVAKDIQNRLEAFGYAVMAIASSGEEAIQKIEDTRPDLVLMDIVIKGCIGGVEASKQIRNHFDIPVVYLTAYADERTFSEAITAEPYGYIVKPFRDIELITTINTALYKHRTEKKLKENERWLATTLKSIGDGVITTDSTGTVTFVNSTAEVLTGWKQEYALNKNLGEVFNIINEKTRTLSEDPVMRAIREETYPVPPDHTLLISKDGTEIFISHSAAPIRDDRGNFTGAVLVFRDITKSKQTEELLRRNMAFIELLQKIAVAANEASDFGDAMQFAVDQVCTYIGWPVGHVYLADCADELTPTTIWHLENPERFETFRKITEFTRFAKGVGLPGRVLASGKTVWIMDVTKDPNFPRAKQAQDIGVRAAFGFPVLIGTEVVAVLEFFSEEPMEPDEPLLEIMAHIGTQIGRVVERKRAEEALKESEERYRTLVETAPDVIFSLSTDGKITSLNQAFEKISGWPRGEWINKPFSPIIHANDLPLAMEKYQQSLKGETPTPFELRMLSQSGEYLTIEVVGTPQIHDGKVIRVLGIARDITKRKKIEKELLKTQKLESIGVLAGGIAHDFNNLLMAVLGNISILKMYKKPSEEIYNRLTEAERACIRATDLTHQLLTFAKGGSPVKRVTSIGQLIKESTIFALRGSNVICRFSIPEELWFVEVDEGQISQAINNLVINAKQAMPKGGVIRVMAENIGADDAKAHSYSAESAFPLKKGKSVRITVEDEGIGISEDHLSKIFDPYFTTKQNGNGLGLATTYSIIRNHDGDIEVESKLGIGTKFHIYLPASRDSGEASKYREGNVIFGMGRVLVMDDEETVREAAGEMLKHIGYEVEYAADGVETIKLYKSAKDSNQAFDVVLMDLVIPGGMGGKETIQKLLEIDPKTKAIVSSGYSDNPVMSEYDKHGFKGVITKPYTIAELSKILNNVISEENF